MSADISAMPTVSKMGPVQGLSLTLELPTGGYALISEAALYNYSGLRLEAIGDNTFKANFTEGVKGFEIDGDIKSPWRTVLIADDLNALVNNTMILSLNPKPDSVLFKDQSWIKTGKASWRWWSQRNAAVYEEELNGVKNAKKLGFEYALIDEGWQKWADKWQKLSTICKLGDSLGIGILVWQHSKDLISPENDYPFLRSYLDSVAAAGAKGVKIDFMNGQTKELIDFDENVLKKAAERKLMVNFHGLQQSSGEARTYPNEISREGIRGGELNGHAEGPITASHNAALPFTRYITGHADYTPLCLTGPGTTSWAHQLATLVCFFSPIQCIAENPDVLLNEPKIAPFLDLISKVPSVWDETVVLKGSKIGSLAMIAHRKDDDWYIGVINGDVEKTVTLDLSFADFKNYKATLYADDTSAPKYTLGITPKMKVKGMANPYIISKSEIPIQKAVKIDLAKEGGAVIWLQKR